MKSYQHIIFWILVVVILTLVFANWFRGYIEAFYYVALLLPVVIGTSYFFNYFLIPRYLFTRKFFLFVLYSVYMLIVSLCLELLAGIVAMLLIIQFGINRAGVLVTDVFTLGVILYFIVFFESFLLLIKHYFIDQQAIRDLKNNQIQLSRGFMTVRSNRQLNRVRYEDISFIESLADYVKIHLENGHEITSREKISHMEKDLPDIFLRVHRSFIVNLLKIDRFTREFVVLGEKEIPVSRTYRKEAIPLLENHRLNQAQGRE